MNALLHMLGLRDALPPPCKHHWHNGPSMPAPDPDCALDTVPEYPTWFTYVRWCCQCDRDDIHTFESYLGSW